MAAVSSRRRRKKARIEKEAVVQVPEDVTVEILKLLPVKSLLRFTCACKTWYSIITHPEFFKRTCVIICERRKTFVRVESLLEKKEKTPIRSAPLSLPWQQEHTSGDISVLGSCNGLVCVYYYRSPDRGRSGVFLWNPLTGKFRKLPPYRLVRNIAGGFGYDGSRDDYKFVWMACRDDYKRRRIEFDVFSLKSKTWRTCHHYPSSDIILSRISTHGQQCPGVLSNGAIHWIVRYKDQSSTGIRILALDLASEKCILLESPRECGEDIKVVSLRSGCLCLYTTCQEDVFPVTRRVRMPMPSVDLWMMKEYGVDSSWIKLVSLPRTPSIPRAIYLEVYHPIHFSSEEGNIVAMTEHVVSREACEITRLQVKNGVIVRYETLLSVFKKDVTIVLEESLVSLN